MNGKNVINGLIVFVVFTTITSCIPTPSESVIQTAIAQTQAANPTPTHFPTETFAPPPTETPTITPSPTPDLLLLQANLKDFLLQLSDFPLGDQYAPIEKSPKPIPNQDIQMSVVKETGRIDGWSIQFGVGKYNSWKETMSDEVTLYQTEAGAQEAVNLYKVDATEEVNQPTIGDKSRLFYDRLPTSYGENPQGIYTIVFSYHNFVHVIQGFGWENKVIELTRNMAVILVGRLQTSPLINP